MQFISYEQAKERISQEASKDRKPSNTEGALRDKYQNDVDVVRGFRASVARGATLDGVGKARAPWIVFLSQSPLEFNNSWEHSFYDPATNKSRFEYCHDTPNAKSTTTCPICLAAKQKLHGAKASTFRIATLVLMERIDENNNTVTYDKKLLVVKGEECKNFMLFVNKMYAKYGTIRGLATRLVRGTADTAPASGTLASDGESIVHGLYTEEQLNEFLAAYQPTEVRSKDGKFVYRPHGWLIRGLNLADPSTADIWGYTSKVDLEREFSPNNSSQVSTPLARGTFTPQPTAPISQPLAVVSDPPVSMPTIGAFNFTPPANISEPINEVGVTSAVYKPVAAGVPPIPTVTRGAALQPSQLSVDDLEDPFA